jgi:Mor family transcriptional regulator
MLDNKAINHLLSYLKEEDIPDIYQPIIQSIGLDTFLKLLRVVGGETIYFPQSEAIYKKTRNRLIVSEFNGNYNQMARRFGVTDRWVRKLISEHLKQINQRSRA